MTEQKNKKAGFRWVVGGFAFGIFAWLLALVTDNGDGRVGKTTCGCLFWTVLLGMILLVVFAASG